jgi:hypothetical protein
MLADMEGGEKRRVAAAPRSRAGRDRVWQVKG